MKRLHFIGILMVMLSSLGFKASALTMTIEWDIPGSIAIQTGNLYGPYVELSADQTSYTYNTDEGYGYIYVHPAEGYALMESSTTDGTQKYTPVMSNGSQFLSISVLATTSGKTVKVNCVKIERDDEFTINVVNGASSMTATFESGYKLDLEDGVHKYAFNPQIDGTLTVVIQGVNEAYTFKLDGEDVAKYPYGTVATYRNIAVTPGCTLLIQATESEAELPHECTLTFVYGEGMEGCIYNIYVSGNFLYNEDIKDNTITVMTGTQFRINFETDDYDFTSFELNGTDITSEFLGGSLRLTLKDDTNTLKINGTPKMFNVVDYTVYVTNPEGVEFSLTYGGEALTVAEGEAVTSDITLTGGFTMPAADTKILTIPVSEKNRLLFFRPKKGYYIATVQLPDGKSYELHSGTASQLMSDGTEMYMVVEKLPEKYTAQVTLNGNSSIRAYLKPNGAYGDNWGNPDAGSYSLKEGEQTISFIPGYSTPLTVSMVSDATQAVYLDGGALTGVLNNDSGMNDYTIDPYVPASADAPQLQTSISIFAGSTGTTTGASLVLENDMTAGFFYSPFNHEANPEAQIVLAGTQMSVKPSTPDCYIKYRNEIVHGYKDDGSFVNGLNEDGEYVFVPAGNGRQNIVTVGKQMLVDFLAVQPADGSTVKTINKIDVTVPSIDENGEKMLYTDYDKLAGITITKNGVTVATGSGLDEIMPTDEGHFIFPVTISDVITEEGEYVLTIPSGTFYESAYDEEAGDFVAVDGGYVNKAYVAGITVDPTMKTALDYYEFQPADGSTVNEIGTIVLVFTQLAPYDMFTNWEFPNASITDGTTSYDCIVSYDWSYEDARAVNITPVDSSEEPVTITTAGEWTLTVPADSFNYEGSTNGEITAKFTIEAKSGIDEIGIDASTGVTVVGLDGKVILKDADPEAVNGLAPGLYIINGVKAIVRK